MKILICGSDESGKTTFAEKLIYYEQNKFDYYKDEDIATAIDGTDLTMAEAVKFCTDLSEARGRDCVIDYKAPTDADKSNYDTVVYMNTLESEDGDFEVPSSPDYTITEEFIGDEIDSIIDSTSEE